MRHLSRREFVGAAVAGMALQQAQATLDQAVAQAQITAEHDQSDLADARYNVEKARLQTTADEFVGRIKSEQAKIDLGVAEQKLKVQEATVALHAATDRSKIASLTRQRDLAQADISLTKGRIAQMEIRAPLTGFAVFAPNYSQGWLNAKSFKVGDNVYSGMNLAEMPDMSSLVMDAKAEETDRGLIESADKLGIDQLAMHHGDLAGRPAEIDEPEDGPVAAGVGETNGQSGIVHSA